jgi:hypothetical protein
MYGSVISLKRQIRRQESERRSVLEKPHCANFIIVRRRLCIHRIKINYHDMKVLLLQASMVAYSQDVSIIMGYLHVNLPITILADVVVVGNPYDTTFIINP